ncbi:MAG: hypothetical protein FD175_2054 [Beijerinckiaceae bacterium]|nr:MAG: hypothetical protein FD175_2054 [Beijerinckiaceae bacterium]
MLNRRSILTAALSVAALPVAHLPALARAPVAGKQVAGIYRQKVGSIEVTCILDGFVPLSAQVFTGAEPAELKRILAASGLTEQLPTAVNAFVVNTGEKTYLIDSGTGSNTAFGPDLGRVQANLAAAGIKPADIDAVILTHAHTDHVEGLIDSGGKALFPNAELVLHRDEHRFWLDDSSMNRMPEGVRFLFASARKALAPYAKQTRLVTGGEIFPGVTFEPAVGHTPGHSVVRVNSGSEQMIFIGDIIHNSAIHTVRPDVGFAFDTDAAQAAASRKRIFDMIAADGLLVAGAHIAFPGVGRVLRDGPAFRYVPAEWRFGL